MKEYILLIMEFFWLKGIKKVLVSLIIPFVIGWMIFCYANEPNFATNGPSYQNNLVSVLGILIGFTISTLTLLLTVNHPNIEKAKKEQLLRKFYNSKVSLYDTIVNSLAYIIIVQGFLIIVNFVYPIFIPLTTRWGKFIFALNISLLIHIIIVLLKSVLDFYFIVTKKDE